MSYKMYRLWDYSTLERKENLSSFESFHLHKYGDELRKEFPKSQYFWRDGAYCWYTDETQSRIQSVYLLVNGVCCFRDFTINGKPKVYKVEFNF